MIELSFPEIYEKLESIVDTTNCDAIVAVARGGLIPGAILSALSGVELHTIWLEMYKDGPMPEKKSEEPQLTKPFDCDLTGKKVLLVDDFSRSGKTLEAAKEVLLQKGATEVKTLVLAGKDGLFPSDICVKLPWNKVKKNGV